MADEQGKGRILAALSPWQVLQSLGEALAVVDRDYRIVWFQESLADCPQGQDDKLGNTCFQAFFDRQRPCTYGCPVSKVLADGRPHMVERHFVTSQGVEMWREARAYPIMDPAGRVAYVARISFDITQRKTGRNLPGGAGQVAGSVLQGLSYLHAGRTPLAKVYSEELTGRELEVLRLLAQGRSKPQIGRALGISINTVKRHVSNIFGKLGVNDRTQAALWAARQGLI